MNILTMTIDDTDLVESWLDSVRRTAEADAPDDPPVSLLALRNQLAQPWYGHEADLLAAVEAGASGRPIVLGWARVIRPMLDNTKSVILELSVVPERRGEGIGGTLLDRVLEVARAAGRTLINSEVRERLPDSLAPPLPGAAFAERMGAKRALTDVRRRLAVSALDEAHLAGLAAEARTHNAGYRIESWSGLAPEYALDGLVVLEGRMSTDIPLGDSTWEPEAIDRKRVREIEQDLIRRGARWYDSIVVHEESGDVVGMTRIVVDADVPQHGWQWNTIVLPDHRGHRLGTAVKLANLEQVRAAEPALATVDTWNAEENSYMIRVNEVMGFYPVALDGEWELAI